MKIGSGATPRGGRDSYKDSGIPLIRSQNVLDFAFSEDGLAYIDENQAKQLDNVNVKPGDVLINITGDSIARVCKAPAEYLPARVNQHVAIVRIKPDKVDQNYLLYCLQYQKAHLLSLGSSGGTRNALTKQMLEDLQISLPQLSTQYTIGYTLSLLDAKIENNKKINHHLASTSVTDSSPDTSFGRRLSRKFARLRDSKILARILCIIGRIISLNSLANFTGGIATS
jgi:type I restriction enzyme S subunit